MIEKRQSVSGGRNKSIAEQTMNKAFLVTCREPHGLSVEGAPSRLIESRLLGRDWHISFRGEANRVCMGREGASTCHMKIGLNAAHDETGSEQRQQQPMPTHPIVDGLGGIKPYRLSGSKATRWRSRIIRFARLRV
jgi:hypothetical protein